MKEFRVRTDSLHYRLAMTYGGYGRGDMCAYVRRILMGLFNIGLILGCGTIVSIALVDFTLGIIFSIMYGSFMIGAPGFVLLVVCVAALVFFLFNLAGEWFDTPSDILGDNFMAVAYVSWKEKYCMRIQLIDKGE